MKSMWKPTLFSTLIKKMNEDKYLVDNYTLGLRITLNESGVEILRLCDGNNTLNDMITHLNDTYFLDDEDKRYIVDFINRLARWGFFNEYADLHNESSITIDWDITYRCNLKCKHCIVSAGKPLPNELLYDDITEVLKELAEAKFKVIAFSGGEPFIRKDFLDIVEVAHNLGFIVKILSNGTLINEDVARMLNKYEVAFVQISLDGATAKIHDDIRGMKGAFNKTINGIKELIKNDISVGIGTVLMEDNFSQLEEIANLCIDLGVSVLMPDILLFKGQAAEHKVKAPSFTELEIDMHIKELSDKYKNELKIKNQIDTLVEGYELVSKNLISPGCSRIRTGIAINPEGYVFPCKGFYGKCDAPGSSIPLTFGRLPENSISDILFKRKQYRVPSVEKMDSCQNCKYNKICGGGCFAENFEMTGSYGTIIMHCKQYEKLELSESEGVIRL